MHEQCQMLRGAGWPYEAECHGATRCDANDFERGG